MAKYFNSFPLTQYNLTGQNVNTTLVTDILEESSKK